MRQRQNAIASINWSTLSGKPSTFAPSSHTHPWTEVTGKPAFAAVATSGDYNDLANKPTIPTILSRSQSSASRSLNSGFQISATRDSLVNYCVDVSTTLSLTGGQTGTVFLEIASDSGFTTSLQEVGRFVNGNTGTLTIGLNITQNVTGNVSGYVPAAYYTRIRTANTVGTPTFNYRSGQEVLL